jgi:hypothetical protein
MLFVDAPPFTARTLCEKLRGDIPYTLWGPLVNHGILPPDLRRLAATLLRLEAYLSWAESEWNQTDATPLTDFQLGYVEGLADLRRLVVEGDLTAMLRDVGEDGLAKELQDLLGETHG